MNEYVTITKMALGAAHGYQARGYNKHIVFSEKNSSN